MKKIILIALSSLIMTGCYKDNAISGNSSPKGSSSNSGSGSSATSHYCGYPTQNGTPCKRLVSGSTGYCWQHR
jgi:hypothetical protein